MTEPLKRREVPPDVEAMFNQLKSSGGYDDIEDTDAGLRFQYEIGILGKDGVERIVKRQRKLLRLMEKGIWQP